MAAFHLLLLILALPYMAFSLSFKLEYNKPFCFIEDRPTESDLVITYELILGAGSTKAHYMPGKDDPNKANNGIVVTIIQPDGASKVFVVDKTKGVIKYPVENEGKYRVCFNNLLKVMQRAGESVSMSVRFSTIEQEIEHAAGKNVTEDEHVVHLTGYSEILTNKAKDLGKYQEYEITKEGEFKDTIENTNSIIQWCAIMQTIVFCALGAWQIWSLRRFFVKRGIA